jgi:hypothetical protein
VVWNNHGLRRETTRVSYIIDTKSGFMVAGSDLGLGREITRVGHRIDSENGLVVARSNRRESTRVGHRIEIIIARSTRVGHRIDIESGLVDARGCWLGGTCRCCNIWVMATSDTETEGSSAPGIWALLAQRPFIFSEKASEMRTEVVICRYKFILNQGQDSNKTHLEIIGYTCRCVRRGNTVCIMRNNNLWNEIELRINLRNSKVLEMMIFKLITIRRSYREMYLRNSLPVSRDLEMMILITIWRTYRETYLRNSLPVSKDLEMMILIIIPWIYREMYLRNSLHNSKVLEMMMLINNCPKNLQGNVPEEQFSTGPRYQPIFRYRKIHPLKHSSIKKLAQSAESGFRRVIVNLRVASGRWNIDRYNDDIWFHSCLRWNIHLLKN